MESKTTLTKNQEAKIPTKSGKDYSYQYVDIAQIHDYLDSINARYIQQIKRIENDDYIMTKRCFNNEWENEWLQGAKVVDATLIGVKNPAQEQGSALTYARKYSLLMAFGLATEDDDANSLNQTKELTKEEAENYIFTFGKHKGKKLKDLVDDSDDYIDWLLENSSDNKLLKMIDLLGKKKISQEEQTERLKLISRLNDLVVETDTDYKKLLDYYKVGSNSKMTIEQLNEAINTLERKLNK